ncbi:MAG TPA: CDP-glucose 4,6-dehydratase [Cyclobacteriaceae bacterium]|nr:CDP-glucose 4,6-dehydratase [Cyclobacteriaceae bacterium]
MDGRRSALEDMEIREALRNTYAGKRVLVTGHTGFKGSWLVQLLHHLGAEIKGIALAPEAHALYNQINGDSLCTSVIQNILDQEKLTRVVRDFQPEFVFHLAAQAIVRTSYDDPTETWSTNLMGSVNLLEAIRKMTRPCTVVMITTDKVYQNLERGMPFLETDPLGGHDPYSASKAAAELAVASYRSSFFANAGSPGQQKSVSSARAGNVVGGGDWSKDRLVPDVIRSLIKGEEIVVRNPDGVRPWQYVLEPLIGYLQLAMHQYHQPDRFNEAWNFGPTMEAHWTVNRVVNWIADKWGGGRIVVAHDHQKKEAQLLHLRIDKAEKLGWKPRLSIEETLAWTTEWYQRTEKGGESHATITQEQIVRYLDLLV